MKQSRSHTFLPARFVFLLTMFALAVPTFGQKVLWTQHDSDPYLNLAFSHDGSLLAIGREDSNTSDLVTASDGMFILSFTGRFNGTNDLLFSLDDQYLLNGTGGGGSTRTLNLWSVADGKRLIGPIGDHNNGTHSLSLSPDGQYLATSGIFSRDIKIWHVPDLTLVSAIPNDDPHNPSLPPRVKDVAFSRDGQIVASSDVYGIKFRNPLSGALLMTIATAESPSIEFSPDGAYIAAAVPSELAVKLWRTQDGVLVRTLSVDTEFDFPHIEFSPDGQLIAAGYNVGADAGAIRFWEVETGRLVSLQETPGAVHSIKFSPDGVTFAYAMTNGDVVMSAPPRRLR